MPLFRFIVAPLLVLLVVDFFFKKKKLSLLPWKLVSLFNQWKYNYFMYTHTMTLLVLKVICYTTYFTCIFFNWHKQSWHLAYNDWDFFFFWLGQICHHICYCVFRRRYWGARVMMYTSTCMVCNDWWSTMYAKLYFSLEHICC